MSDSASRLWADYLASGAPDSQAAAEGSYSAWQFGYGVEQGNRLLACVLEDPKRATAGRPYGVPVNFCVLERPHRERPDLTDTNGPGGPHG